MCPDAPVEIHWFDLRDADLLAPAELSPEERFRSSALRTETLRRRYTASHVALRRLLSSRLGVAESRAVPLFWRAGVKPYLCTPTHPLTFSLSRSADVAAVALGDGVEVGVDVDVDRDAFASAGLREAILTPFERAVLEDFTEPARSAAAQRLWVRKEAILKALGTGFVESPAFVVAGDPRASSGVQFRGPRAVRWHDVLAPHESAAAAVAWCERDRSNLGAQRLRASPVDRA